MQFNSILGFSELKYQVSLTCITKVLFKDLSNVWVSLKQLGHLIGYNCLLKWREMMNINIRKLLSY